MKDIIPVLTQAVIGLLLLIVVFKVLWNFALPYAMLRMRERKPVAVFPLIELAPFALAILISWLAKIDGLLSIQSILSPVGLAVLLSYAHFVAIAFWAGMRQRR